MTINDKPAFHKDLLSLHALYPMAVVLDSDQVDRYWRALRDLSLDMFARGITAAAKQSGTGRCKFFPSPGVIRELGKRDLYEAREELTRSAAQCPECRGTGFRKVGGPELLEDRAPTVERCRHPTLRNPAL